MGKYYEWNIRNILQKIIEKPADVQKYIEQCYDLYCDDFGFMDNLGVVYGIGIAYSNYFDEKLEDCYPQLLDEVNKVTDWLDNGKIVITGHSVEYHSIEYDDHRNEEEKTPTGYKIQK